MILVVVGATHRTSGKDHLGLRKHHVLDLEMAQARKLDCYWGGGNHEVGDGNHWWERTERECGRRRRKRGWTDCVVLVMMVVVVLSFGYDSEVV